MNEIETKQRRYFVSQLMKYTNVKVLQKEICILLKITKIELHAASLYIKNIIL